MTLRVAKLVVGTRAEGPGLRSALWLQGCSIRCANCCNPEMFSDTGGQTCSVEATAQALWSDEEITGITLLGGEPFEQAASSAQLAQLAQRAGLSVMIFSGHTLDTLRARSDAGTDALLAHCDLLVDGPYVESVPERERRWIGSQNQQMHFLSDRYDPADPCFREPNTVEIRYRPGSLTVSGWPSASRKLDPRRKRESS